MVGWHEKEKCASFLRLRLNYVNALKFTDFIVGIDSIRDKIYKFKKSLDFTQF